MKVVFTVCNYNAYREGVLTSSLERLAAVKDDETFVLYFDNASRDGSVDELLRYYRQKTIDALILSNVNMGKAYAMNVMFQQVFAAQRLSSGDVLVNMDSDVQIMDLDFVKKLRLFFANGGIKYIGYAFYKNESMTELAHYNYYQSSEHVNIAGCKFDVLINQHGLAGGILATPVGHFRDVGGYQLNLGPNGSSAVYGGDDAVLLMKLFKSFPEEKALCCVEKSIVHFDHKDAEYQKWKQDVISNMQHNGFGNSTLPKKGFYD